jgi:flagellar basal-body rod modification protein FlgD
MDSISALPAGIAAAARAPVKSHKTTLDQADFLALMTAQLKNQDPTKPVDNSEYVAQLAQFSTVSGIAETNGALARIAEKLDALIAAATPSQTIPES